MSTFKRYKSIFGESKKEVLPSKKKSVKQEAIINALRKSLKEEEGMSAKEVEAVVGKIEGVITDVISSHGVDNVVVDALANTVKDINSQNAIVDEISYMEKNLSKKYSSIFAEAEEKEEEEDMKEEMEDKEEEEMEEAAEEEDDEMEEKLALRRKAISEMKKKLSKKVVKEEMEDEEEEDEEEEEMEEDIYGFSPNFSEESMTDEGDLIDDESGSDYDALSIDSEGNASSGRGMEADMDDNASADM